MHDTSFSSAICSSQLERQGAIELSRVGNPPPIPPRIPVMGSPPIDFHRSAYPPKRSVGGSAPQKPSPSGRFHFYGILPLHYPERSRQFILCWLHARLEAAIGTSQRRLDHVHQSKEAVEDRVFRTVRFQVRCHSTRSLHQENEESDLYRISDP